jgi:hypothetical protein
VAGFFKQHNDQQNQPNLLSGAQPVPVPLVDQVSGIAKFGLGVGALSLIGQHQFASGKTGWDYYLAGLRGIEEYSPASIFRTFQLSHMFSPLESASKGFRYLPPEAIRELRASSAGYQWLRYHSKLAGADLTSPEVMEKGLRFERGQLLLGKTGNQVLLEHAGVIRTSTGALPTFQESYARSLMDERIPQLREAFTTKIPFVGASGEVVNEAAIFVGGKTKSEATKRYAAGFGTSLVERFNRLLASPMELPGLGRIGPKIGKLLSVEPGAGLKTYGKLALKLGIGLPAAYMAYGQVDWLARQILPGGITGTLATAYTKAHVAVSTVAELTGLHALREKQEEIAPGSTSLTRLLGFPLVGFFAGASSSYFSRVGRMALSQFKGSSIEEASLIGKAIEPYLANRLYGKEIPEEFVRRLDKRTISLVEKQTEKILSGWEGKVARAIVNTQEKKGLLGGLSRLLGQVTPGKIKGLIGAGIGLAVIAPFIPGALVPEKRPDELRRIYSGQQLVPIKKGRWWEFNRSPIEGGRPFFAPSWYARIMMRGQDMITYGRDLSPLGQWYERNFTYKTEERNYWTRPYPMSGSAFADTPLVGPLLSATIGRIVKPPRLMHPEMWQDGGLPQMPMQGNEQNLILPGQGISGGLPISPSSLQASISNQADAMKDVIGLPGFVMSAIKQSITGRPGIFDQQVRLASAGNMYSAARDLYEEELGGMGPPGEIFRRLYPRPQRVPEWNAIPNAFADVSWLPGAGEFSPNFRVGDPFSKIPMGSYRLPGPIYEAMHPSAAGLNPNDYPLLEKFRILAGVAPWSGKYHDVLGIVKSELTAGGFSQEEEEDIQRIMKQVDETKTARVFHEYKYRDKRRPEAETILASINEDSKSLGEPFSWFGSAIGSYWETLSHNVESPLEQLLPIAPAAKFVHMRTATEDYEKTQLYGKEMAFWQNPVRDFIKPFLASAKHAGGWNGIPENVEKQRSIESYFDALKWLKYTKLKREAQVKGDMQAAEAFETQRRSTLIGANLLNPNPTQAYRAMPRRERDYFDSFVKADLDERVKILKMVPQNEKAVYIARWLLKDADNSKKLLDKSILTFGRLSESKATLATLEEQRKTEGMPTSTLLNLQYWGDRQSGENYADWYRRTYLVPQATEGFNIPGPSWVGFRPEVELQDIKLKVVENLGESPEQYDIWPEEQYQTLQKPYLEAAAREVMPSLLNIGGNNNRIRTLLSQKGFSNIEITTTPNSSGKVNIDMDIQEDRSSELKDFLKKRGRNF